MIDGRDVRFASGVRRARAVRAAGTARVGGDAETVHASDCFRQHTGQRRAVGVARTAVVNVGSRGDARAVAVQIAGVARPGVERGRCRVDVRLVGHGLECVDDGTIGSAVEGHGGVGGCISSAAIHRDVSLGTRGSERGGEGQDERRDRNESHGVSFRIAAVSTRRLSARRAVNPLDRDEPSKVAPSLRSRNRSARSFLVRVASVPRMQHSPPHDRVMPPSDPRGDTSSSRPCLSP